VNKQFLDFIRQGLTLYDKFLFLPGFGGKRTQKRDWSENSDVKSSKKLKREDLLVVNTPNTTAHRGYTDAGPRPFLMGGARCSWPVSSPRRTLRTRRLFCWIVEVNWKGNLLGLCGQIDTKPPMPVLDMGFGRTLSPIISGEKWDSLLTLRLCALKRRVVKIKQKQYDGNEV